MNHFRRRGLYCGQFEGVHHALAAGAAEGVEGLGQGLAGLGEGVQLELLGGHGEGGSGEGRAGGEAEPEGTQRGVNFMDADL